MVKTFCVNKKKKQRKIIITVLEMNIKEEKLI